MRLRRGAVGHARTILAGGAEQAAASIGTATDAAGLRLGTRKGIDDAVGYLKNKAACLRFTDSFHALFAIVQKRSPLAQG